MSISMLHYRIAQNYGGVNFWWLVARHAIGGKKFGESSTTGSQVHLPNPPKFSTTKILHYMVGIEMYFSNH